MIKNSIVLVPFPFDDFSSSKVRPALCLTSEIGNYNHVIIAFISSKLPDNSIDSDLVIRKNTDIWKGTGLIADSVIRLHKMVTIPKSLIKRKLGAINKDTEKIIFELNKLFVQINLFNPRLGSCLHESIHPYRLLMEFAIVGRCRPGFGMTLNI